MIDAEPVGARPVGGDAAGSDDAIVEELLGRRPQGRYEVVVRRPDGTPVVIRNAPLLYSGRPMPTRFWLVDRALNRAIGTLESAGGVDRAEAEVDPQALRAAHAAYARARDAEIPVDHEGPRPSGGVGGTRVGVKCLHAHYAHFLAGGDDPVGRWVDDRLRALGADVEPVAPPDLGPVVPPDPGPVVPPDPDSGAGERTGEP